jgi:hypothetical protein
MTYLRVSNKSITTGATSGVEMFSTSEALEFTHVISGFVLFSTRVHPCYEWIRIVQHSSSHMLLVDSCCSVLELTHVISGFVLFSTRVHPLLVDSCCSVLEFTHVISGFVLFSTRVHPCY